MSGGAAASARDEEIAAGLEAPPDEPAADDAAPAPIAVRNGAHAAPRLPAVPLNESIRLLKEQQRAMKDEKKALTKTLRNAVKRKTRLQKRARQLSEQDLLEVLRMRHDKNEVVAAAPAAVPPQV